METAPAIGTVVPFDRDLPSIGDNSRHFGEELRAELETVLSDDHEAVFRYAQWHIGDYITGTNGMNLEAEGGYIRFLMRLYQRGKPLPDDDRFMAACMNLSLRVWKRIRDALVGFGKIIARNGCLTNARFEKERIRRAEEMKKKADAANKRWLDKQVGSKVSAKLGANLGETSSKHSANIGEKTNKINGNAQKMHMLTNNQYPIEEEREEKEIPASTEQGAASGQGDHIEGLNSATTLIVNRLAKWINPYAPDYVTAHTWLKNSVHLFSGPIVRDAFADMEAKAAANEIVGSPIKLFSAICQQKAAKAPRGEAPPGRKPEGMPEKVWREIQSGKAKPC